MSYCQLGTKPLLLKKKTYLKTLLYLFLAFTTLTVSAQSSDITWLKGTWAGSGYQPSSEGQINWKIEFKYQSDLFLIHYPSFPCGGTWELVKIDDNSAHFIERITDGTDKCANNLVVFVQLLNKKKVKVSFIDPTTNIIEASGILRKKKV